MNELFNFAIVSENSFPSFPPLPDRRSAWSARANRHRGQQSGHPGGGPPGAAKGGPNQGHPRVGLRLRRVLGQKQRRHPDRFQAAAAPGQHRVQPQSGCSAETEVAAQLRQQPGPEPTEHGPVLPEAALVHGSVNC